MRFDWVISPLRCSEFESKLEGYSKELEGFRKREVMTTEEMKTNVEKLSELSKNLDQALLEFEVRGLGLGASDSATLLCGFQSSGLCFPNIACRVDGIDRSTDRLID